MKRMVLSLVVVDLVGEVQEEIGMKSLIQIQTIVVIMIVQVAVAIVEGIDFKD